MNPVVVDASVVLKWALDEEHSEAARRLRSYPYPLYAPDFLWTEVSSVICQRVQQRGLGPAEGRQMLIALRGGPIHVTPASDLLDMAFALALQIHSSIYDCLYLSLAILLDGRMATADRQFCRKLPASPYQRYIVWVADL